MERKHTRLIPSGSAEVNGAAVIYSVVVRDIFNCEGDAVGEIYGARVAARTASPRRLTSPPARTGSSRSSKSCAPVP